MAQFLMEEVRASGEASEIEPLNPYARIVPWRCRGHALV